MGYATNAIWKVILQVVRPVVILSEAKDPESASFEEMLVHYVVVSMLLSMTKGRGFAPLMRQ